MTEEWRDIPGYEGRYQASCKGRIRSVPRTLMRSNGSPQRIRGRIVKDRPHNRGVGYRMVSLCLQGKITTHTVHKLVAWAFYGPRPEGMQIAHKDGDGSNNKKENLRYATPKENSDDRYWCHRCQMDVRHG